MFICWLIRWALTLENMADKVKYVQFLHDASEIRFSTGSDETKNNLNLSCRY